MSKIYETFCKHVRDAVGAKNFSPLLKLLLHR